MATNTQTQEKILNKVEADKTSKLIYKDLQQVFDAYLSTVTGTDYVKLDDAFAKKCKDILLDVDATSGFNKDNWIQRLQLFFNAWVVESAVKELNSNLANAIYIAFGDDTHEDLVAKREVSDLPDLAMVSSDQQNNVKYSTIEIKIMYDLLSAKRNTDKYHDADYVLIFILKDCYFTWAIKEADNSYILLEPGKVKRDKTTSLNVRKGNSIRDKLIGTYQFLANINLPDATELKRKLVKLDLDIKVINDYEAVAIRRFKESFKNINSYNVLKESHGAYSNELDLTKALENKDECIKLISNQYAYAGPIETGGFYIMPDGTAVKSVNHADIDKFLVRNKYITGKVEDYGDGSQFMDAINCVRLRRRGGRDSWILPYMILPKEQLTQVQYNIISNWVDFVMSASGELSVQTMTGECKNYHSDADPSDIMADIRSYYRFHFFEDYESIYEPEIDSTDYRLEKDLENGFYDQF